MKTNGAPIRGVRDWGMRDALLGLVLLLAGTALGSIVHMPALMEYGVFKDDLVQSPHWAAYHTDSFRPDDPILAYASFNESPLQNAIYWIGTLFLEVVVLCKVFSVVSYGLLALSFYVVGRAMYGTRFGFLLAVFITLLPDQWEFSAGFFSKFWAIPSLLVCVFLLQTERWKGLIGLLPFCAIAYPSTAVVVGMVASVYWLQELRLQPGRAAKLFRYLAIGSALAVALLLVKYASPPDTIGVMRSGAELRSMPEVWSGGYPSHYLPIPPLSDELIDHVEFPFTIFGSIAYFLILGRRGVGWHRAWTALFLASAAGYVLADLLFMRLYIPDRYTRYSLAVLIALWNARNCDLILERVSWRSARVALVASLIAVGLFFGADQLDEEHGWSDRTKMTPISRFIRDELPKDVLIAGSPKRLDDVMLQGKRSVLVPYKLAHPWFTTYYDTIREATWDSLVAHFAATPEPVNRLHERYGATHFLLERERYERFLEGRRVFAEPYNSELLDQIGERESFLLYPPPPELVIWRDDKYALIELPIPSALDRTAGRESSGDDPP